MDLVQDKAIQDLLHLEAIQVVLKDTKVVLSSVFTIPKLAMSTTASPKDHDLFGHKIADTKRLHSKMHTIVCDTICMSTAIQLMAAYKVGIKNKDFIPVVSRMNGAGRSDLCVIVAVVMEFNMTGDSGCQPARSSCATSAPKWSGST